MKRLILKLKHIEESDFDVQEIEIIPLGNIAEISSVSPICFFKDYSDSSLWIETCRKGESPVLLYTLGIYNLKLPCIVEEVIIGDEYPNCCKTCKYLRTIIMTEKTKYSCGFYNKQTKLEKCCKEWAINPMFL